MKKYIVCIIAIIMVISCAMYCYYQYKIHKSDISNNNEQYENLYNKSITGAELASVINKTIDRNEKNKISKDKDGFYEDDGQDSIKISIKFKDSDKTYQMEALYNKQVSNFVKYYSNAQFKCTKKDYHSKTNKIKYLYFEEQ